MDNTGKIIVVDYGCLMFTAIFSHKYIPQIPLSYNILNMLFANLLKIGLNENDEVMIAVDCGRSWRKEFDENYKSDRKEKREKQKNINWEKMFAQADYTLDIIDKALPFHVLKVDSLEADDFMSYIPRYYSNKEVILVSFDSDLHQLLALPNVKIFSPKSKKYKVEINPYKELAKKVNKEATDGLVNPILNEADFDKRSMLVSLLELPKFIEIKIKEVLDNLPLKGEDLEQLPFQSIREKYLRLLTDKSKVITMEQSMKKKRKRKNFNKGGNKK